MFAVLWNFNFLLNLLCQSVDLIGFLIEYRRSVLFFGWRYRCSLVGPNVWSINPMNSFTIRKLFWNSNSWKMLDVLRFDSLGSKTMLINDTDPLLAFQKNLFDHFLNWSQNHYVSLIFYYRISIATSDNWSTIPDIVTDNGGKVTSSAFSVLSVKNFLLVKIPMRWVFDLTTHNLSLDKSDTYSSVISIDNCWISSSRISGLEIFLPDFLVE